MNQLPNLLIIGAMKAGTTSLHHYLALHPDIYMSKPKELNFFCTSLNYNKGINWYKAQFDTNAQICGESSPNYTKWPHTPVLISQHLGPKIKMIYILRNPVNRFISQCNHTQVDASKLLKSDALLTNEIFTNGLYYRHISNYSKYFNIAQNLLILKLEELNSNKTEVLKQIFNFLKIDSSSYPWEKELIKKHVTEEKKLATKLVTKLNKYRLYGVLKNVAYRYKIINDHSKQLYNSLAYKQRKIYTLTNTEKSKLAELYHDDLLNLNKSYHINYLDH